MESKGIKAARTQYLQSNKTWKQTVLSNISTTSLQLLQIKFNKENQKKEVFFFSNKFERLGSNTGLRVKQRVWGVFHKGKTSYSYSLPRFPAEGIFNTWEIFFLASSNSVKTLKF